MNDKELIELSFRNMVEHYKEELIQILNGAKPRDVFTESKYLSLKRLGVLNRRPSQNRVLSLNQKLFRYGLRFGNK